MDSAGPGSPAAGLDASGLSSSGLAPSGRSGVGGALVLVATPIGNMGDLAPRAIRALAEADVVACEDTRRTGRLLASSGVTARRLMVVNDHTEAEASIRLVEAVGRGERVALVTDAGMPGIADPGERLVAAMVDAGLTVEIVPGPSSPLAGLVLSGFSTARFVMEGFLPRRGIDRVRRLESVAGEGRTVVLLEAPHRLVRTVADLAAVCGGDRRVALCRELTKMHEQVWRGTLAEAVDHCDEVTPRGEYVVVVQGAAPPPAATDDELRAAVRSALSSGLSTRDAADQVAAAAGVSRRRVYELAVGDPTDDTGDPDEPDDDDGFDVNHGAGDDDGPQ
jgi:16S rRNA (cytidine1402-2'-O)-methyltransferase